MRCKAVSLVVLACFGACTPVRAPAPPTLATTDPAEVLAIVRSREDEIRTLRATFETSTRQDEKLVRTIDGVLLVRKPDAFRLRLSTPLGLTAFDYLSRPDGVHVVSPFAEHGADAS
jgi:outer membrane lipoprotein-sorting protein